MILVKKTSMGAISHIKITYQNDNFELKNRQVTPVLPNYD